MFTNALTLNKADCDGAYKLKKKADFLLDPVDGGKFWEPSGRRHHHFFDPPEPIGPLFHDAPAYLYDYLKITKFRLDVANVIYLPIFNYFYGNVY